MRAASHAPPVREMTTPEKKRRRPRRKPSPRQQRRLVKAYAANVAGFLYDAVTPFDWDWGCRFFPMTHFWCYERAVDYGVDLECVCAVVSALSPANPWKKNMADAESVINAFTQGRGPESVRVSTYGQNKRKAFRVLTERNPELVKTSQKTRAFVSNIFDLESDAVTVDVHAYSVARAKRHTIRTMVNIPKWRYLVIAEAYRTVGRALGLRGADVQAITWIAWKRVNRIVFDPGLWMNQLRLPFNNFINVGEVLTYEHFNQHRAGLARAAGF